jgi:hypothetical protein
MNIPHTGESPSLLPVPESEPYGKHAAAEPEGGGPEVPLPDGRNQAPDASRIGGAA